MRTEPQLLHGRTFDFAIIGGGIHGAALARELALAGTSVCLLERGDFAQGTSSRSSRLVHGGLRYLREGNLKLVRESLRERELLLRLAPHLVRPLPMVMPFHAGCGVQPWLARLGVTLYGWLAGRSTLPRPRRLSPDEAVRAFPGLRRRGLRGGLWFHDALTEDLPLTLAVLRDAVASGALACNHAEVTGRRGARLLVRDRVTGAEIEVGARVVLNAAGPRVDPVRRRLGIEGDDLVRVTRGSHLVLDPRPGETALCAFLPDRRIQFVVPHEDGTLCGTTEVDGAVADEEPLAPEGDVEYLLEALGFLLDQAPGREDVRWTYCGWRSLPAVKGPPGALHREAFTVREQAGELPVHSVVGGKLTTHRSFAERVVSGLLGRREPSPTRTRPLPGAGGPQEPGDPLWWRHGDRARVVRELVRERPEWGEQIGGFLRAEVVLACREDGVVGFDDLMLRRLWRTVGPLRDDGMLRECFALYRQECASAIDEDVEAAVAKVRGAAEAGG